MKARKNSLQSFEPNSDSYFRNYAGSGKPYARVWKDHSYFEEVVAQFQSSGAPRLKNVCVLGAGPGLILDEFQKQFPRWKLSGCEISRWAHARIPKRYKNAVLCQSMQDFLRTAVKKRKKFDLIFSNSLVYLEPAELDSVLKDIFSTTKFFHFNSSFRGAACPDPYRKILRTKKWWDARLKATGFVPLKDPRGRHTFLWLGSLAAHDG